MKSFVEMETVPKGKRSVSMLDKVKAAIHKYSMFTPGDRVLVGVSGGPDSVALLHILNTLAGELGIRIAVAHLNHSLRGQAAADDAEAVRRLAGLSGNQVVIECKDVAGFAREHSLSIQEAAREVRYRFFVEAAKQLECSKLATGHNANDQAETVLFQFLRGSGAAGLAGIPPVRDGWIVRPLLETRRREIEQYCISHDLPTRTDQSNLKTVYTRNKIRLQLFPLLEQEYNINLVEILLRTSEIMREQEEFMAAQVLAVWPTVCTKHEETEITFDLEAFLKLPVALQPLVLRDAWEKLTGSAYNLGYVHISKALSLLKSGQTGSRMDLPDKIQLTKSYGGFYLSAASSIIAVDQQFFHHLRVPGFTLIPETGDALEAEIIENVSGLEDLNRPDEIVIDLDLVTQPLAVRSRKPGERFRPRGQTGSKKVKRFLIDCKVSRQERARLPVLVTADDQVIWLAGLRADDRWSVNPKTKRVLKLKLIRNVENKIKTNQKQN
ncbi:MAG: tRNA lysidine(34) synthetase TilS [Thermincola sp.]|nr:tRNA lysidine(34) synthetase TilS [Thermincola sp.]MDT3702147.1 tRNA lysidine(34) synthetase TilS [Thermincola sp.]